MVRPLDLNRSNHLINRKMKKDRGVALLLTIFLGPFGLLYTEKWVWSILCIGMYLFLGYDIIAQPMGIVKITIQTMIDGTIKLGYDRITQDICIMIGIWILSIITSYHCVSKKQI